MVEVTFANPSYLWTLLLIPFIITAHILTLKRQKTAALKFSNFEAIERVSKGEFLGRAYSRLFTNKNVFLLSLRVFIYITLIFSVTGTTLWYTGKASDFDFIIAVDTSTSMLADDFNATRLGAAKNAAQIFIDSVQGKSAIGVVSFASTVFVDKEPIESKEEVKNVISSLDIKESGGTNIGDAIITSTNLMKGDNAKVIILLTDGQSNTGTPVNIAIDYAKSDGIIVHTIGVGTEEGGKIFGLDITSKLDEESLRNIAENTAGKYFKAGSKEVLENAFKEIASFTERIISINISWVLLIIALVLLAVEWILTHTIYKTIP